MDINDVHKRFFDRSEEIDVKVEENVEQTPENTDNIDDKSSKN